MVKPVLTLVSERSTPLSDLDMSDLILKAQSDDKEALGELVRRVQKRVYLSLHQLAPEREDIADLAQDVLLKMCRNIKSLRTPATFKVWLNRILTNLYYDELRKTSRRQPALSLDDMGYDDEGPSPMDVPDERYSPDKVVMTAELQSQIRACMAELPEPFRLMIVMRDIQGLTYEEIAELTSLNLGTVKSRLARARQKLQLLLTPLLNV
jgi:RNA polymerase sigma-70 factor, ECF subfamily